MTKEEAKLKVRSLRARKGLTIQQVADLLGVSRPTVTSWENDVFMLSIKKALRLADILGCNFDDFFID